MIDNEGDFRKFAVGISVKTLSGGSKVFLLWFQNSIGLCEIKGLNE